MVSIQHLSKVFNGRDGDTYALCDVSLEIPDGDIFGIIGISGAGKSTLVRCVNLLKQPTSGRILVDGTDVTALRGADLRAYRHRTAMIFQGFGLLAQKTALEERVFSAVDQNWQDARRCQAEGYGIAGSCRSGRQGRFVSSSVERWSTTTCGHRACAGMQPHHDIVRRGNVCP